MLAYWTGILLRAEGDRQPKGCKKPNALLYTESVGTTWVSGPVDELEQI